MAIIQCWPNVKDVGPTLYKCYANGVWLLYNIGPTLHKCYTCTHVLCLLGRVKEKGGGIQIMQVTDTE